MNLRNYNVTDDPLSNHVKFSDFGHLCEKVGFIRYSLRRKSLHAKIHHASHSQYHDNTTLKAYFINKFTVIEPQYNRDTSGKSARNIHSKMNKKSRACYVTKNMPYPLITHPKLFSRFRTNPGNSLGFSFKASSVNSMCKVIYYLYM